MKDADCVHFLQKVLPSLGMRWPGFRKVRGQVCKRVQRRIGALGLAHMSAYLSYLEQNPSEWQELDTMCRISISRFYRDIGVFNLVRDDVLPLLACQAMERGDQEVQLWSAGCASGEEPYTLRLIWEIDVQCSSTVSLAITATDADSHMLKRALHGCYPASSVKDFPAEWRDRAFQLSDGEYCVRSEYRRGIQFICQDIRREQPDGIFDLIMCRHLAFTYFDESLQRETSEEMIAKLRPGGFLVIGKQEKLPHPTELGMTLYRPFSGVYRRSLG